MASTVDSSEERKKKILRIIEQKGMCSMMNTTKWRELKKVITVVFITPAGKSGIICFV